MAGQYSQKQFVSAFTGDGATPIGVTQFGELLFLYVSNSYDTNRRANVVSNYMSAKGIQIIGSPLTGCSITGVDVANRRLGADLAKARNSFDFQSVLQSTVRHFMSNPKAACDGQAAGS